ncbi:hypothetical protein GOHSU_12_00430 [Gordonia hirsuta DSM 44140 = NBRC 16056]|uniref:Phage shock protein PspC N-terminal domain-containing protein n=1 Tax=Gordonia hirsuta DSM 44140 = NBRC 16056 TaxID=1121927 RepID=L7L9E4_9ACTN|nr:PspC domain-containing protein [Gordonia hirsuta]GAC56653.1 hypothetical protein GOHSU_12_00430 [Gordonia hirsuta DSM 44140 = NBRC 16056]
MNSTTLSDLWATRPVRPRRGRKVAGVCAGFGARYDVDPTLVRVAFAVSTLFGGAGLVLYLAAAFTLPSQSRQAADRSPDTAETTGDRSGTAQSGKAQSEAAQWFGADGGGWTWPKVTLLVVLTIVVVSNLGSDRLWSGGGVLGTILMLAGWWLLYQRTPIAPDGTGADAAVTVTDDDAPPTAPVPPAAAASSSTPGPAEAAESSLPPRWDPLGVAPFAWDLPEPPPAPEPVPAGKPKSPLTPIVTGLAILVAVAGTLANLLGAQWFTVGRIASLALIVLAVGMLVAASQRRSEGTHADGLIPLSLLVGAIVVVATLMTATDWSVPRGGIGERAYEISAQSQLQDQYSLTIGSTKLDLRRLDGLTHDQTITIDQGIGDIKVTLPDRARVQTRCHTTIGDFTCPAGIVGADEDGPILTIEARLGLGTVEMK